MYNNLNPLDLYERMSPELQKQIFNEVTGISRNPKPQTPKKPDGTITLPSTYEEIQESWNTYINSSITGKEMAKRYGVSSLGPIRKRWIDNGIYDPVMDYFKLQKLGITGFPIKNIVDRIDKAGRINEIQPGVNGTVEESIADLENS